MEDALRLLIVEDSPLVRKMYGLAFSKREHELTAVEDGLRALDVLAEFPRRYDLILLDLRMPDMDGVEFIRAVRKNSALDRIPIVLTTAEPEESVLMIQARALGVAAVVRKPWKPQDLRDLVQTVVQRKAVG
jgi:two-component system chemotaxis response regulator CheY